MGSYLCKEFSFAGYGYSEVSAFENMLAILTEWGYEVFQPQPADKPPVDHHSYLYVRGHGLYKPLYWKRGDVYNTRLQYIGPNNCV